jgi:hypothetical protein
MLVNFIFPRASPTLFRLSAKIPRPKPPIFKSPFIIDLVAFVGDNMLKAFFIELSLDEDRELDFSSVKGSIDLTLGCFFDVSYPREMSLL